MRRHILALCTVALGLGTLAACAQPAGSVNAGSNAPIASTSPSTAPSAAPSASPTLSPLPSPAGSASKPVLGGPPGPVDSSAGPTSLTGQITSGAEPSCLLLTQNKVQYLLLAPDSMKMRAGVRAVVTGHVETGIMTHCQQGKPFEVTGIDVLAP
jgi:hypothetical protein